jgi:hypothetical protein
MEVVKETTGASLREPIEWHQINWSKANRTVRRLQVRIVKAILSCVPHRALERLEPTAVKIARWVLRGERLRKEPDLPDTN